MAYRSLLFNEKREQLHHLLKICSRVSKMNDFGLPGDSSQEIIGYVSGYVQILVFF